MQFVKHVKSISEKGLEKKIEALFLANSAMLSIISICINKAGEWVCWYYAKDGHAIELKE